MASRDRTTLYCRLRDQFRANKPQRVQPGEKNTYNYISSQNLIDKQAEEGGNAHHSVTIPPDWLARVSEIQFEIQRIKGKLGELGQLHTKQTLPGFDDEDRMTQEHAIEIMTADITKLFQNCHAKIKQIGAQEKLRNDQKSVKENIQKALANDLQELSTTFRKGQEKYLDTLRARTRKLKAGAGTASFVAFDTADEEDGYVDKGFTPEQLQKMDNMDARITQRERDINLIAKSINDLAVLFQDLNQLVIEQGTILDRIDYNIESTQRDVDDGYIAVTKASKEQKRFRTGLCILLLLLLIFIMIIVVLVKAFAFGR